ncbi:flagellar basal-body MS-ring/collar protein FliF [Defluviimonas sp. WL0024]|uniref:Flagellar M-ring protein n=1 Tax=Albidovulum salinarum TaxID=2984153 RepID=A0ABT2X699_9RHOB|nr:flagellar basal-body MS-ring/collar protein FliF [Defluviimonas sp. WL0024]MCU9849478.1 flagellar basal-body MS-ring/collar protein FliF [Defluviimonas sp. WL0024]
MQQLTAVWQALDPRRRAIVAVTTLAMFAAVLALANLVAKPSMALLYAGLDGNRSGEVLAALDQRGAVYEVRGTAIYVEGVRRDELRMTLAAEGLPANSGSGYELLDSLTGFGTTSQMFDAAYLRAKEGELARTISALPQIRSARVHIAETRAQGLRAQTRPSASVAVTTATGGITPPHAKALKFLVSSAVAGLAPEDVAIIDGAGGLVIAGDEQAGPAAGDRAEELRRNVERLLEARVGYGNAVVEVSVETVTEREAITERRFDPDGRVAISTDTEERTSSSNDRGSSAVTVASNLPSGDANAPAGTSQSQNSETRERTNFEVSETTREVLRNPGAVRRLTVAVLVDGVTVVDDTGATRVEPRSDNELAALRDLVSAAVGFDADRGDVITLKSMSFEPLAPAGEPAGASYLAGLGLDAMSMVQLLVLAIVTLVLGLFVIRPILTSRGGRVPDLAPPRADDRLALDSGALTGEIADDDEPLQNLAVVSGRSGDSAGRIPGSEVDPVSRLRQMIAERQDETVEILRGWMEDPEEERA